MSSIDQSRAGVASGINNAVSRVAGLLAIAVLGLVFATTFNGRLERGLDGLGLPVAEGHAVEAQRGRLAAATSDDVRVRGVIWEAVGGDYCAGVWSVGGV